MEDEIFESDIYTLTDEDGNEAQFELIGSCEIEGNTYRALIPLNEEGNDEEGEYVILKCEMDDNGEECLVTIDDDEEFDRIADIFEDELADIFYDEDDQES